MGEAELLPDGVEAQLSAGPIGTAPWQASLNLVRPG